MGHCEFLLTQSFKHNLILEKIQVKNMFAF